MQTVVFPFSRFLSLTGLSKIFGEQRQRSADHMIAIYLHGRLPRGLKTLAVSVLHFRNNCLRKFDLYLFHNSTVKFSFALFRVEMRYSDRTIYSRYY